MDVQYWEYFLLTLSFIEKALAIAFSLNVFKVIQNLGVKYN